MQLYPDIKFIFFAQNHQKFKPIMHQISSKGMVTMETTDNPCGRLIFQEPWDFCNIRVSCLGCFEGAGMSAYLQSQSSAALLLVLTLQGRVATHILGKDKILFLHCFSKCKRCLLALLHGQIFKYQSQIYEFPQFFWETIFLLDRVDVVLNSQTGPSQVVHLEACSFDLEIVCAFCMCYNLTNAL